MQTKQLISTTKQMLKTKIKKDGVELEWQETTMVTTVNAEDENEVISTDKFMSFDSKHSKFPPHVDFINAMKMLRKPTLEAIEDTTTKHENLTIKGFSLSGMDTDDEARVVITASKKLDWTSKPFNFNTPPVQLGENEAFDSKKLDKYLKKACDEGWLYIGGKHAENPQLSLTFEGGEQVNMDVQN